MKCSCVILNYNDSETTKNLINIIKKYDVIDHILVVDNSSTDNSYDVIRNLESDKVKQVKTDHNGGYGYGNNFGVKKVSELWQSKYTLIINPDVYFTEETLAHELELFNVSKDIAIVSPCQLDINHNMIEDIAWRIPNYFEYTFIDAPKIKKRINMRYDSSFFKEKSICEVDCIPGSWLLVDTEKFLQVGGYDEEMFLYCEETTIGTKMKRHNYKTILDLRETYIHQHSVSINKSISDEFNKYKILVDSRLVYIKKYLSRNWLDYKLAQFVYAIVLVYKKYRK